MGKGPKVALTKAARRLTDQERNIERIFEMADLPPAYRDLSEQERRVEKIFEMADLPEAYKKKPKTRSSIDNIFEMADLPPEYITGKQFRQVTAYAPRVVRRATKGGADGMINTMSKLLREMLDDAEKINLIRNRVFNALKKPSDDEKKLLMALKNRDWADLMQAARKQREAFQSTNWRSRNGAVHSLKGKVAEYIYYRSPAFTDPKTGVLKKMADVAEKRGLEGPIFVQEAYAFSKSKSGKIAKGELTDGLIVARNPDSGRLEVLAILEMKSRSNRNDLAQRRSRDFELEEEFAAGRRFAREGQLAADIERLDQLELEFDGKIIPAGETGFSRKKTLWIGVVPKDVTLSELQKGRISKVIDNFEQHNQVMADKSLTGIARKLIQIMIDVADG